MLAINMDDVINVLNSCKPYLIALGIALAIAIIVTVACMKLKKPVKKLVRKEAWIAFLMAAVVIINLICFIPMSSMISLAMGNGTITEETSNEATALCEDIADEGIVLLKNEDNILPLTNTQNINVFGWASTNPCYGGTGSGALSDAYETTTLLGGLEDAGYKINTELTDFYKAYREDRPEVGMWAQDWTLPEPTADSYSDELINNAKEFSDTAMVVITRVGGEGADLPTDVSKVTYTDNSENYKDFEAGEHYLQLSQTEKDMLDLVCANFDNVVVVYNGANTMELGFLNDYKQIKGAIWCPGTGQSGFESLGAVVAGTVNPSGKTSDTFVYDLTATPTYNNFGNFLYDNMDEFAATSKNFGTGEEEATIPSFVNYVEGIYVGYRFYETAAVEGLIDYDKTVQFPFGYGLSYTDFEQKMGDVTVADGKVSFDVTVTNNGTAAGKDVVEVYYNPPYTNGGIEKASAKRTMSSIKNLWQNFADKHPGASKWVREGGLFVIVSNLITVFKYLMLLFLPLAFAGLPNIDFGFPGIDITLFGETFKWNIIGYDAAHGGLPYFCAYMVAMVIGECINFPIQRTFVFRSKGNIWYQAFWYLIAFCIVTCIVNSINCIWVAVAGMFVPDWLYNIGTTVLNGGVSMVVFFFVNKIIFPEGEAKA